jgi:hypothetical protein
MDAAESGGRPFSFAKLINSHLSHVHRKNPGTGCACSAKCLPSHRLAVNRAAWLFLDGNGIEEDGKFQDR